MDASDDDVTEKEILLEIFREVRWIGRYLAVTAFLGIIGAVVIVLAALADAG